MFIKNYFAHKKIHQAAIHLKSLSYLVLFIGTFFIVATHAAINEGNESNKGNKSKLYNNAIKLEHYNQLKDAFRKQKITDLTSLTKKQPAEVKIRIIVETDNENLFTPAINTSNVNLLETQAKAKGIHIHRKLNRMNMLALSVTEKQLDELFNDDKVVVVSEDRILNTSLDVSVPHIGGDVLHHAGFTGQGQTVAILDTGVDSTHPFLGNRVIEEACFSSGDQQVFFSLCPNMQGSQVGAGTARDCMSATGVGSCIHGTHVAGIAAGANATMKGTAPDASIIAVQVFTFNRANKQISAFSSDIIAALDWLIHDAHTPNVAAVNLSLGGGIFSDACDDDIPAMTSAIQALREQGVATVIASGNNAQSNAVSWPGCISSAITVGASLRDQDFIANFSNTSPMVDLIAPGDDILSSIPGGTFTMLSGTSMATPHVTGAFAALKSLLPTASIDYLEKTLKQTGKLITASSGIELPRIDMAAAYKQIKNEHGSGNNNCITMPGDISTGVNAFANGSEKSWAVFVPQGGLFRVHVRSAASFGSNLFQVTLNGSNVVLAVAAGGTTLADFANINAGSNILKVVALSDGVILDHIWVEQLTNNSTSSNDSCSVITLPIPGGNPSAEASVISENVGPILMGTEKSWQLLTNAPSNIRILVSSANMPASRHILVTLDNTNVDISIDANATVPIDFANVATGTHRLAIKAFNDRVVIGKITSENF